MPQPTAQDHRSWAKQNEAFYEHVGGAKSTWPGWPMTVLFYVAVHEVLAFLLDRGTRSRSHRATVDALRTNPLWTSLAAMYEQFFGYSRDARYRCKVHTETELKLAENLLAQVRAEIERLSRLP